MVTNAERPNSHPIYALDTDMGSTIFFTKGDTDSCSSHNAAFVPTQEELDQVWEVSFYGAACREGEGARVWVSPPGGRTLNYSYKLAFDCTNNEVDYEAMVLAIRILKDFQVRRVMIHGDSDLVIKKMTG